MLQLIFSKDRSIQLESFLRSMKSLYTNYKENKNVLLYNYSNDNFKKGYDILQKEYSEVEFIRESNIRQNVIDILDNHQNEKYVVFYCDDNIWKESFNLNCKEFYTFKSNEIICCFSLRMHPRISKCYTANIDTPPPEIPYSNDPYIWNWVGLKGDWGYPMSIDGHIFRYDFIRNLLKNLNFTNVNLIEAYMSMYPPKEQPYMICGQKSYILNIPLNRVQTTSPNINMNVSIDYLNDLFLSGKIIDTNKFIGFDNISPHQEVEISFIERSTF